MKPVTSTLPFGLVAVLLSAPGLAFPQSTSDLPQGIFISREPQDPFAVSNMAGVEVSFLDGRYELRRDGEPRVVGRYTVRGDTVVLTDIEGVWACTGAATAAAAYTWRASANQLELAKAGEDRCRRRRIAGVTLIPGRSPAFATTIEAPAELRDSWRRFWIESDAPGWVDLMFTTDAVAEDGARRLNGIEAIKQWLGGQDSRGPNAFPFEFRRSDSRIVEKGRYRDVFGSPDGSTRILVGRYQITWVQAGSNWKVQEWILR